jgi:alanyl-tRNA synthetase
VQKIENLANEMVRRNLPVKVTLMPRGDAEEKYGFKLYQGGVVPTKTLRVINIGDWDIEACGGTHTRTTGDVGLVKVVKVERVQDGVERLEFVAGEPAIEYLHQMESTLDSLSSKVGTQRENLVKVVQSIMKELEEAKVREKALSQKLADMSSAQLLSAAKNVKGVKVYVLEQPEFGEEQIIAQGQKATQSDPFLVYASVLSKEKSSKIICFAGSKAVSSGVFASEIVRRASAMLGGAGGGTPTFAQGGGPLTEKAHEAAASVEAIVASLVRS